MTILSPSTLALLRDANVRKAVDEILGRVSDSKTVTVVTPATGHGRSGGAEESTQVTVRRVA